MRVEQIDSDTFRMDEDDETRPVPISELIRVAAEAVAEDPEAVVLLNAYKPDPAWKAFTKVAR